MVVNGIWFGVMTPVTELYTKKVQCLLGIGNIQKEECSVVESNHGGVVYMM